MDPVTSETLAELIASAVTSVVGRAWKQVRGTPEGRAVKAAIGEALRMSALPPGRVVDDAWVAEMEKAWRPAFTKKVSQQLVACLGDPSGDAAHLFGGLARQALADSGDDLREQHHGVAAGRQC